MKPENGTAQHEGGMGDGVEDCQKKEVAGGQESFQREDMATDQSTPNCPTGGNLLLAMLSDPDTPIETVQRQISLEIAVDVQTLKPERSPDDLFGLSEQKAKNVLRHIKALRELQRSVGEAKMLSRKQGFDLNGPEFGFVIDHSGETLMAAMTAAGASEYLVQQTLNQFACMHKEGEEGFRRELARITAEK